ncbi:MAG: DNA-binding response regulator [Hydrogenimonas sp.]|nr:MAG: DNA-binding response regulator [Hydrogenimonas sp.]
MKILLLEDELMLNDAIVEFLEMHNHEVIAFFEGNAALECIKKEEFDLLILDISVPNIDGLQFLEILQQEKIQTPAIFISAMRGMEEIAKAYELGCYDYLKKPFHLPELLLHIQKIDQLLGIRDKQHIRLSRRYSFDKASDTLLFDHAPVALTKRQMEIIRLLAIHQGNVVDFEMLRHYVWDDAIIDNATIRAEVSRLKKSLKEDFIVNIRGVGYRIDPT